MLNQKRGKAVAVVGTGLQVVFSAVMLTVWLVTGSQAALSCLWLLLGGVLVWLMAALMFYGRQLARREAIELEEISARGGGASTIFEGEEGAALTPAADRVAWMERWLVPIFTLVWAGYHAALAVVTLRYLANTPAVDISAPAIGIVLVPMGFVAFLFSRYATGMAKVDDWRGLRATGSYLLANVVSILAVAGVFLAAYLDYAGADRVIAHAFPVLQLVLAVELVLNFVLDIYRARLPDQPWRPSYESRFLNLLAEPERVGHSIAETLNYQFGFDVSSTWFYQLLQRAMVPLLIFAVLAIIGMTSIVIVNEGEQVVLSRFGRVDLGRAPLGPGIHFKWPWPIDRADHFDAGKVQEITLGVGGHREPVIVKGRELFLWSEEHGRREEKDFLIAVSPKEREPGEPQKGETPPVHIMKLVVAVYYRIRDVYDYGYNFTDSRKVLESLAQQEMTRYCASATLDERVGDGAVDRPEGIMSFGRGRAAAELRRRIQTAADANGLGAEITYVGIVAAHPPSEAAPAYEKVLEAERRADETRYKAEAEANKVLARVAGDPTTALRLALAIRTVEDLERLQERQAEKAEAAKTLRDAIRRVREDLKALDEEIDRDRLLGKKVDDPKAYPGRGLREEQQAYLTLLRRIQARPRQFAYAEQLERARQSANDLFREAAGEPAKLHAQAVAYRWKKELTERARYESFLRAVPAYEAAPNIYLLDRWLDVWDEVLPSMTKYVLGVDRKGIEIRLKLEHEQGLMEGIYEEPEPGK